MFQLQHWPIAHTVKHTIDHRIKIIKHSIDSAVGTVILAIWSIIFCQTGVERRLDLVQYHLGGTGKRLLDYDASTAAKKPPYIVHPLQVWATF